MPTPPPTPLAPPTAPVPPAIPRELVGFVDSPATPSLDPERLGRVEAVADGPLHAWGHTTIRLRYVVGHHGLDDRGGLKIVMRFPYDGGDWQVSDPAAENFVRVSASRPCAFRAEYKAFGDARPWFRVFRLQVTGGSLGEGDTVDIVLGERSGGSPGMRVQSFCEDAWELRVLVDPCATGHFREVLGGVAFPVLPGPAVRWRAVLPGRRRPGDAGWLGLKAEDAGGNPTTLGLRRLRLRTSLPVSGLPEEVERWPERAIRLEGWTVPADPGQTLWIAVEDADTGEELGRSNPMRIGAARSWWGDLHGQSGETVGINSADAWFRFGRDLSFLDGCAHQANCFQINSAFWSVLDALSERWEEPGRYITPPGYEWSGNTAVGGDRNVWYRRQGRPIRRSSHALLTDHHDAATDATTARALFAALEAEEQVGQVVVAAHVGGRHADLAYAHDGRFERVVEVHSAWGTFEWLLLDALALGHRVGVVANSDGHKGRPGASYPGASTFGAVGGLTAWAAEELTRDGLFEALLARRTWATSGSRIDLDVVVRPQGATRRFQDDPAVFPEAASSPVEVLGHGDIAATAAQRSEVGVSVRAPSGLLSVELRVGAESVNSWRPPVSAGRRLRLTWEGAEYRGRGRQTCWDGEAELSGASVRRVEPFAAWSPERGLWVEPTSSGARLRWKAVTTGNRGGWDLWWEPVVGVSPRLVVRTGPASLDVSLAELPPEGLVVEAGGLGRRLHVVALPEVALPIGVDLGFAVDHRIRGDTPIWVVVSCEDGHQAWSSPVYLFPESTP